MEVCRWIKMDVVRQVMNSWCYPLAVPKWKRQRWKWLWEEWKERNRKDEDEIERYKNRRESEKDYR